MAWRMGKAVFADGTIRFFLVNGIADVVQPRLFKTEEAANEAWRLPQEWVWDWLKEHQHDADRMGEPVKMYSTVDANDADVWFESKASWVLDIITGPLSSDGL